MNWFMRWFHRFGSPVWFYRIAGKWLPWLSGLFLLLFIPGLYWGLFVAPTDYQQGESFRIMYVHVPAAWMSMFIYVAMAVCAAIALIWRMKLADVVLICSAPVGASFTFLALITGSLWGKPMWGTYWVWDARLTSELILLFLYLGIMALYNAFEEKRTASRAVAILTLVGVVNIPIIHYSVVWWNTLHQGASVSKMDAPSIHVDMLIPLILLGLAFQVFYVLVLFLRVRAELLDRELNTGWVRQLALEHDDD
ncbi:heme ABC transporter permease [Granulosicoccaceae sp. 1_MG-2023]|nr:heme ABC transporter permease [Granulosicoccaceae sp. 1_MG-2023]